MPVPHDTVLIQQQISRLMAVYPQFKTEVQAAINNQDTFYALYQELHQIGTFSIAAPLDSDVQRDGQFLLQKACENGLNELFFCVARRLLRSGHQSILLEQYPIYHYFALKQRNGDLLAFLNTEISKSCYGFASTHYHQGFLNQLLLLSALDNCPEMMDILVGLGADINSYQIPLFPFFTNSPAERPLKFTSKYDALMMILEKPFPAEHEILMTTKFLLTRGFNAKKSLVRKDHTHANLLHVMLATLRDSLDHMQIRLMIVDTIFKKIEWSPLQIASYLNHASARIMNGKSLLHFAVALVAQAFQSSSRAQRRAITQDARCVKWLLEHGTVLVADDENRMGVGGVFTAANHHLLAILELFSEYGLSFRQQDVSGKTTLHVVCAHSYELTADTLSFLLSQSIAINLADRSGKTAMHYACQTMLPQYILQLIDARANLLVIDNNNNTLLHSLCVNPNLFNQRIEALLLSAGVAVNALNKQEETALHLAAKSSNKSVVEFLLRNGADPLLGTAIMPYLDRCLKNITDSHLSPATKREKKEKLIAIQSLLLTRFPALLRPLTIGTSTSLISLISLAQDVPPVWSKAATATPTSTKRATRFDIWNEASTEQTELTERSPLLPQIKHHATQSSSILLQPMSNKF